MLAYVEAMVSFELSQIQLAQERLSAAESLCKQFAKRAKKKYSSSSSSTSSSPSSTSTGFVASTMDWYTKSPSATTAATEIKEKNHHHHHQSKLKKSSIHISPDLHYELLETCCTLMSCTLQFLSHHWMDYVRAAYKLRKTYKKFEQLFEFITGHKASDYAQQLNHRQHYSSPSSTSSSSSSSSTSSSSTTNFQNNHHNNRKRKKSHKKQHKKHINHTTTSTTATTNSDINNNTTSLKNIFDNDDQEINSIQSGVYFGIGLLSLIFSLLPPKGKYI